MGSNEMKDSILKRRYLLMGIACLQNMTLGGILYGWAAIASTVLSASTEIGGAGLDTAFIHSLFIIASTGNLLAPLALGFLLDTFGPRLCSCVSILLILVGVLVFGFANADRHYLFTVGITLIGFGGPGVQNSVIHLSNLFPRTKATATSLITGFFQLSFSIFGVFDQLWFRLGMSYSLIFMCYSAVCVVMLVLSALFWPDKPVTFAKGIELYQQDHPHHHRHHKKVGSGSGSGSRGGTGTGTGTGTAERGYQSLDAQPPSVPAGALSDEEQQQPLKQPKQGGKSVNGSGGYMSEGDNSLDDSGSSGNSDSDVPIDDGLLRLPSVFSRHTPRMVAASPQERVGARQRDYEAAADGVGGLVGGMGAIAEGDESKRSTGSLVSSGRKSERTSLLAATSATTATTGAATGAPAPPPPLPLNDTTVTARGSVPVPRLPLPSLRDRPFRGQCTSGCFLRLCLFFCTSSFFANLYIGTVGTQMGDTMGHRQDFDFEQRQIYAQYFNAIATAGVLGIPVVGVVMDRLGFVTTAVATAALGATFAGALLLETPKALLVAFVAYALYRCFLFTYFFAYLADSLGFKYFGILAGVAFGVAGVLGLLQYPIIDYATGTCHKYKTEPEDCDEGSWGVVNRCQFAVMLLLFALPLIDYRAGLGKPHPHHQHVWKFRSGSGQGSSGKGGHERYRKQLHQQHYRHQEQQHQQEQSTAAAV